VSAQIAIEYLSPTYAKLTTMLTNSASDLVHVDLMLWAPLRLGSDAAVATLAVVELPYPVLSLVGPNWTLNAVVGEIPGVTESPCTGVYPSKASWWRLPIPFAGEVPAMSFTWQNIPVSVAEVKNLSIVFGVGQAPFDIRASPSPVPTRAPLTVEAGRDGQAFDLKWKGQRTSLMNIGWEGRVRTSDGASTTSFSYGQALIGPLATVVETQQLSANWAQVSFAIKNGGPRDTLIDLQFWTMPRMGDDRERPRVVVVNSSQGVTKFVGAAFTLQMITLPADGVAGGVTRPDKWDVSMGSWGQVSTPYTGNPDAITWSWFGLHAIPRATTRVTVIFGVGEADFPTPPPVPEPPTYGLMGQAGNATFAFNLRHLGLPTTQRDQGWGGLLRVSGRTTEAFFSSGFARLEDLNATLRFEQLRDSTVRLVFTVNNPRDTPVAIDLLFSCATLANRVTMQAMQEGLFHFDGWDLMLVRYPNGAPCDMLDRFSPYQDSWEASGPWDAPTEGVSFSWLGRRVPAGRTLELATLFVLGTEQPAYATPVATASKIPTATRSPTPSRSRSGTTEPRPPAQTQAGQGGLGAAGGGLSSGSLVGLVVGVVAVVAIAAVAAYCLVQRRVPHAEDELQEELVGDKALQSLYT
jgi:hypothetical protein